MTDAVTPGAADPARAGFDALIEALRACGDMVRDPTRGTPDAAGRAAGYTYVTELARLALDLYADEDPLQPRFVPFSTPTPYSGGKLALHRVQGGANPDATYDFAVLHPQHSYRVTGRRGNDCYLSLSFSGGRDGEWPDRTVATLNDRALTFAEDGSFEVVVSPEPAPGNWVRMEPDMCSLIVRQYFLQPPSERVLASLSIELLDPRAPEPDRAQLSARRLSAAAAFVRSTNLAFPPPAGPGPNAFGEPLGYSGEAGALGTTDNVYVMGRWRLAADEALVVDTTPVPCRYWSLQVWNHWGQSLTQTITSENYPRLIANSARTVPEPDGTTRIVIANRDGGAANWLDTFGWTSGVLIFRYLYPEARPEKPTCRVVPAVG